MKLMCKRRVRVLEGKDDEFCVNCWSNELPMEETIKFEHRDKCIATYCREIKDRKPVV